MDNEDLNKAIEPQEHAGAPVQSAPVPSASENAEESAAVETTAINLETFEGDTADSDASDAPDATPSHTVRIFGQEIKSSFLFQFLGLIAFFIIMALVMWAIWPYLKGIFEPGGLTELVADVRGAGPWGVLVLLGIQFLQVVVALIPGEVVQIAAGMIYGPWLGALIVLFGAAVSSAFIFTLVKKLGAPFVQDMVPNKYLDKFRAFERTGKFDIIVFILFLIPGLPKDVFAYLVPLTDMRMKKYLIISTVGRIPGVLASTIAASGLIEGNYASSIIIFLITAAIAGLAIWKHEALMKLLANLKSK